MKWLRKFFRPGIIANEATITGIRRPLGYTQIVHGSLASSIGLTLPAVPANSGISIGYAVIQANGGTIRWRDDGTAPTSTVGMLIPSGGELNYVGDFSAIRFIDGGTGPCVLDASFYA